MNGDAKIYVMIGDLTRATLLHLLDTGDTDASDSDLVRIVREQYESGSIPSEEIVAAWNDDTWNGSN